MRLLMLLLLTVFAVPAFAQTENRPPCWHEEFAAFSFLEGEWAVKAEDRLADGKWEATDARAWISRPVARSPPAPCRAA